MKKKLLLISLILALAALFALGISASTVYKDESGNVMFSYEVDEKNIISEYTGEFPKTDSAGNHLTWYVTATSSENGNTVKTVASFLTMDEAFVTLNADGVYSYKNNTGVTNLKVVAVSFPYDSGIKKLSLTNDGYRNAYSYTSNTAEILFIYLPNTLTELPGRIAQSTRVLVCDIPFDTPITKISHVAFHDSRCLREINIPATVTIIDGKSANDGTAFYQCESLKRVNVAPNSQLETIGNMAFYKNHSLEYINIPDSVKTVGGWAFYQAALVESPFGAGSRCETIGGRAFSEISTFKTFIVPSNLKSVDILGGQDYGPLALSTVELITFGNATPVTELMPSFFGRVTAGKIILPEGPTSIPSRYFVSATVADICFPSTIETAYERAFENTTVEIIRLGANFKYFANTKVDNHSFTNVTKSIKAVYIPASFYAEKPEVVYQVSYAFDMGGNSNVDFFYTGTAEELAVALVNFKEGTLASGTNNYRFLNATIISYEEYILDPEAYEKGNYIVYGCDPCEAFCLPFYTEDTVAEATIVYESYLEKGIKTTICPICSALGKGEDVDSLFTCQGYSVPENGQGGISVFYLINDGAIAEYERVTGKRISYGVFAASQAKLGENEAVNVDGTLAEFVLGQEIDGTYIGAFEIKVTGFVTEEQKAAKIVLGAYAITADEEEATVSYLMASTPVQGAKYAYITFNEIFN